MNDPNYPLSYYDKPLDYPDFRGKEEIANASIEGEGDQATLVPSTFNNSIVFSTNKSGKESIMITSVTKIKKENNIL